MKTKYNKVIFINQEFTKESEVVIVVDTHAINAAIELGKFGIRVNSLSPAVQTDMTVVMDEKLQKAAASRRPLKVPGTPADVAEGALFLVSDRARFITGDTLHVDGGMHLS